MRLARRFLWISSAHDNAVFGFQDTQDIIRTFKNFDLARRRASTTSSIGFVVVLGIQSAVYWGRKEEVALERTSIYTPPPSLRDHKRIRIALFLPVLMLIQSLVFETHST
jgi:hypothetical protein